MKKDSYLILSGVWQVGVLCANTATASVICIIFALAWFAMSFVAKE